jgi:hypothetical protein
VKTATETFVDAVRAAAGEPRGSSSLELRQGELAVRISIEGGSEGTAVKLSTPYPDGPTGAAYRDATPAPVVERPMSIELRAETTRDVESKARGIDREAQTGDAAFDQRIYIDTPSPDTVVNNVLSVGARAAILSLLEGPCVSIVIDDESESVCATTSDLTVESAARAAEVLAAFVELARALPRVERGPTRKKGRSLAFVAGVVTVAGWLASCSFQDAIAPPECPHGGRKMAWVSTSPTCFVPPVEGLVVGLVLGALLAVFVAGRPLRRLLAGRSDSSATVLKWQFIVAFLTIELTMAATAWLHWR